MIQCGVDILGTTISDKTGNIMCQTGDVVNQDVEADGVEVIQHAGFISRPPKAAAGRAACQAVIVESAGRNFCIATRDARGQKLGGNLGHGESCIYAAGETGTGQARVLCKGNGRVTMFTTDDNTENGKSVYFSVSPDGMMWVAPWGTIRFDESGFHILHKSGASFSIGGIYGMPAPLDQISSYARIQAGTVNLKASAQSFGAGTGDALAGSTAVNSALSAIATALTAIAAQCGPLGNPATAGGAASTAIAAVTAAIALIPTTTSSS